MAKRLQNAQQLLESKEKEVVKLTDIVDKLSSESQAKLGALERVVKARNESYRMKAVEQEAVIKRHNIAFKALQDRYSFHMIDLFLFWIVFVSPVLICFWFIYIYI